MVINLSLRDVYIVGDQPGAWDIREMWTREGGADGKAELEETES
jgi:hypothetical protein